MEKNWMKILVQVGCAMVVINVLFCGKFFPLGDKKKMWTNLTKNILGFYFFNSPYLEGKKR
jgi:hypothetical protein